MVADPNKLLGNEIDSTRKQRGLDDVTIAVDGSLSVERAREVADAVENAVESAPGSAKVTMQVEPS